MAGLAPVIDSLDKVAEPLRQFYEPKDGKYHVILDAAPAGFVPASELATANGKVIEFRDNNILLKKKVEELEPLKTKFEGIDPVAAKEAIAKVEELKKKGVDKVDDVDVKVTSAIEAALKPLKEQLTAANTAAETERKRADESLLRSAVGEKFVKIGGVPSALDFIVGKAKDTFVVADGVVKAQPNKFSSEKPGDPLSVDEWLQGQMKESDFAFKASGGSGADGNRGPGGAPTLLAGQTILKDPTPQQLGENAKAIRQGKMKVVYSNPNELVGRQ